MVSDVIAMFTSLFCFEQGRCIEMADSKFLQIVGYIGSFQEVELAIELEPD